MKKSFVFVLLVFMFSSAKAQFEIDGQIRPRFEHRNGYKQFRDAGTSAANFVSQRTRLRFAYKKDNLEMKIAFQDVHVWGDIMPKNMDSGLIGLHEGWAKITFENNIFFTVGRQELAYDNGRLLTQSNWNQIGFTHDALKLGWHSDAWQIETVLGYNKAASLFGNSYFPEKPIYKVLHTIWISRKLSNVSVSLLNIADVRQKNDSTFVDYVRNTVGPIIKYEYKRLTLDFRAFYQSGNLSSGQAVSAFYLNSEVNFNWTEQFSSLAGFELKSGSNASDLTNTTDHAFDILYGSRHKFNGLMDYFDLPKTTGNAGLVDLYVKATVDITDKLAITGHYHNFSLQNNYIDSDNSIIDKQLGNEMDVSAKIKFSKVVSLDLAVCTLLGSPSLEIIKGGDSSLFTSYAFVMLTIKPSLFKQ